MRKILLITMVFGIIVIGINGCKGEIKKSLKVIYTIYGTVTNIDENFITIKFDRYNAAILTEDNQKLVENGELDFKVNYFNTKTKNITPGQKVFTCIMSIRNLNKQEIENSIKEFAHRFDAFDIEIEY